MRLRKFDFDVRYNEGLLNTRAVTPSRLRSLKETTVPADADIPTYPLHSDATPSSRDGTDDLDADQPSTADTTPLFLSITLN